MDRLRAECPWDARQTHLSLAPYLLEETYEALEALEDGDPAALREELGDVLLQVLFHARIAAERTDGTGFTIDDVADGIAGKLRRRHPHVFGDVSVSGANEVKRNWDAIKAAERAAASGSPGSVLDGVPFGQPALALAAALLRRASRAGVPAGLADLSDSAGEPGAPRSAGPDQAEPARHGPDLSGPDQAEPARNGPDLSGPDQAGPARNGPDLSGPDQAGPAGGKPAAAESGPAALTPGELGSALFALVARAREAGLDPELELRAAARAYRDRVAGWERSGE